MRSGAAFRSFSAPQARLHRVTPTIYKVVNPSIAPSIHSFLHSFIHLAGYILTVAYPGPISDSRRFFVVHQAMTVSPRKRSMQILSHGRSPLPRMNTQRHWGRLARHWRTAIQANVSPRSASAPRKQTARWPTASRSTTRSPSTAACG